MAYEITLANNTLLFVDSVSNLTQVFGGNTIQDVTWRESRERLTIGPVAPGKDQYGNTVPYVAPTPQFIMNIIFKPGMGLPLRFHLSKVDHTIQPTWVNTLAGAQAARADIIAITTP